MDRRRWRNVHKIILWITWLPLTLTQCAVTFAERWSRLTRDISAVIRLSRATTIWFASTVDIKTRAMSFQLELLSASKGTKSFIILMKRWEGVVKELKIAIPVKKRSNHRKLAAIHAQQNVISTCALIALAKAKTATHWLFKRETHIWLRPVGRQDAIVAEQKSLISTCQRATIDAQFAIMMSAASAFPSSDDHLM